MGLPVILRVISSLCLAMTTVTLAISLSKPGCPEKCGNVTIPYPFGIGSECSANSSFIVICQNFSRPFLSSIDMEARDISLSGTVIVNQPVSPLNCSDMQITVSLPISLEGTPFTFSARYNSLAVLGCKNSIWLRANKTTTIGGCTPICDANSTESSCNGVNCCRTTIPPQLKELHYTYKSIEASNNSFCGYAFPVEEKWLTKDYLKYKGLISDLSNPFDREFGFAPLVLEWKFNDVGLFNDRHCTSPSDYHTENDYVSSTKYCSCNHGFEGNPYLAEGCSDIDECSSATLNNCEGNLVACVNTNGSFKCVHPDDNAGLFTIMGSLFCALITFIVAWKSTKAIRKRIKANHKRKFF